jgi:uncharacterized membrane protein
MTRFLRTHVSGLAQLLSVAVSLILLAQSLHSAGRPQGNDFTSYLGAANAFWNGRNPFIEALPFHYIYPLTLCVLIRPLGLIYQNISVIIWFVLSIASMFYVWNVMERVTGEENRSRFFISAFIQLVLLLGIIQNNVVNGQVNFIVLALCAGFLYQRHTHHYYLAGILLGLAIALKLTPLILILFLLVRREWSAIVATVASAIIFIIVVPYFVAGGEIWSYYSQYVQSTVLGNTQSATTGFSLSVFWYNLTGLHGLPMFSILTVIILTSIVWFDSTRLDSTRLDTKLNYQRIALPHRMLYRFRSISRQLFLSLP